MINRERGLTCRETHTGITARALTGLQLDRARQCCTNVQGTYRREFCEESSANTFLRTFLELEAGRAPSYRLFFSFMITSYDRQRAPQATGCYCCCSYCCYRLPLLATSAAAAPVARCSLQQLLLLTTAAAAAAAAGTFVTAVLPR
jgi:hypothetical protein